MPIGRADDGVMSFTYGLTETNLNFRFELPADSNNFFALDESTNLPVFSTRLTTLGGGANGWNFIVLNPGGGLDPNFSVNGGGTNEWNFSTTAELPRLFWRVRRLGTPPDGGYFRFTYTVSAESLTVNFHLTPDLGSYYILDAGTSLTSLRPAMAYYGGSTNAWSWTLALGGSEPTFWAVQRIPAATPLDSDGDGLDDLFELTHGLNPLDPSDANHDSHLVDADNNPLTWLQAYHYNFINNIKVYDVVSREVSSFNFGQATATYEAISREVSVFNTPQPDVDQDGIDDAYELNHGIGPAMVNQFSGFTDDFPNNGGAPLTWLDLYHLTFGQTRTLYDTGSREVSVFNFGQPTANYEAISREVSVFNTPQPDTDQDGIDDAYELNHGVNSATVNESSGFTDDLPNNQGVPLTWMELYHLTFGQSRMLYDTLSREVSVFNFGQATANYESISGEISIFNFGQAAANVEAISREVSVFNEP